MSYKKLYFYSLFSITLIFVQLITSTICLNIIVDILLKRRTLQIDFLTRIGLINDPEYTVVSSKFIFGLKFQYTELISIITGLKLAIFTFSVLILMLFIFKRVKKTNRQRFILTNFIFFSFLLSLILLLHYIPAIFEEITFLDRLARGYNRHLIYEGYITENLYGYYFDEKIIDFISFKNLIEDIILWTVIGIIFIFAIIYIRRENNLKKEIIN